MIFYTFLWVRVNKTNYHAWWCLPMANGGFWIVVLWSLQSSRTQIMNMLRDHWLPLTFQSNPNNHFMTITIPKWIIKNGTGSQWLLSPWSWCWVGINVLRSIMVTMQAFDHHLNDDYVMFQSCFWWWFVMIKWWCVMIYEGPQWLHVVVNHDDQ